MRFVMTHRAPSASKRSASAFSSTVHTRTGSGPRSGLSALNAILTPFFYVRAGKQDAFAVPHVERRPSLSQ
jgi:hypothetical protein